MAAQLQKTFNAETSLIKGGGGNFDVYVDNVLIFSKKKEGRFPNEGEVERLIKKKTRVDLVFSLKNPLLSRPGVRALGPCDAAFQRLPASAFLPQKVWCRISFFSVP